MAVDWYSSAPTKFQPDGYTETAADNIIRSNMSIGPAKVRRRTTANVKTIAGHMLMTSGIVTGFDNWFQNTLGGGSVSFNFPDQRSGTLKEHRLTAPPQYRSLGGNLWQVDLQMEQLP